MTFLHGVISDRLRAMFTPDQILHNAHPDRAATPKAKPVPKNVKGQKLTGRDKK